MEDIATQRGNDRKRFAHDQNPLSAREWEILERVSYGQDGPEIAADLVVSPATVRTHIGNAIRKLGARNRVDALRVAQRAGWL